MARHCPICDVCVDNFDHHCPWVEKCVGRGNSYCFFVIYTVLFFIFNLLLFYSTDNFDI